MILTWATATEPDNVGFNIWRSESAAGPELKLNDALIPAQGDADNGATYRYVDDTVVEGKVYYYWLEDIDVRGVSTIHESEPVITARVHFTYFPIIYK